MTNEDGRASALLKKVQSDGMNDSAGFGIWSITTSRFFEGVSNPTACCLGQRPKLPQPRSESEGRRPGYRESARSRFCGLKGRDSGTLPSAALQAAEKMERASFEPRPASFGLRPGLRNVGPLALQALRIIFYSPRRKHLEIGKLFQTKS